MFDRIEYPEIFIGIVAPVGVETDSTIKYITEFYNNNQYDVIVIHITKNFKQLKKSLKDDSIILDNNNTESKITSYIKAGNRFREIFQDNSILAAYSIFKIQEERTRKKNQNDDLMFQRKVYIIRQFKRKEEVDLMRSVYGKLFFQVSVYAEKINRINYLSRKISHDENQPHSEKYLGRAATLISIDENQSDEKHGQRVTKIFHEADFIVRRDLGDESTFKAQIHRFCELLFASNVMSPTKMEYGMFAAKAAALRTLDLSRQVGAAIFRSSGEILALGSNEVPKAGGGTYWCDDGGQDAREFQLKIDSNDSRKKELLREIFIASGLSGNFEDFFDKPAIRDSQFMDALEYGRIIHAEMSALMDAARNGVAVKGSNLYCTTFPCHMCAKHIVASGIKNVIYLEPYPKSLAFDQHADSIKFDGNNRTGYGDYDAVQFEHFHGITPRRYRDFFERTSRKKDGVLQEYIDNIKRPNVDYKFPFYVALEKVVIEKGIKTIEKIVQ